MYRLILLCLVWLIPMEGMLTGQCTFIDSFAIQDNSTTAIDILVNGLVNDDLSQGNNTVCRVDLSFRHDYLGDLTVTLTSPAGETITLVGPSTNAIGPTNLSTWNISFVHNDSTATPDAGFSGVFNNDQAWQILTPYTGSYYPNTGQFDDFDMGSANGVWTISVADNGAPAEGFFVSASLVFCDENGLSCGPCDAQGGTFENPILQLCQGTGLTADDYAIMFDDDAPDPTFHSYLYVVSQGDDIISFNNEPDVNGLATGDYSICGLSFFTSQFPEINNILNIGSFSQAMIDIVAQDLCAEFTTSCIDLEIVDVPMSTLERTICQGDTLTYQGVDFTRAGIFMVPFDIGQSCDSIVSLSITVNQISAEIATPDTLTCNGPAITLDGSGSTIAGNPSYAWTTLNGMIVSNPNAPTIEVNSPGQYILEVSDGSCSDIEIVDVLGGESFPQVFASGGTLTCDSTSITILTDVFPLDANFEWRRDGGGVFSNESQVTVTQPGNYTASVTDQNGCTNVTTVLVDIDTLTPRAEIIIRGKDCFQQLTFLQTPSLGIGATYLWTSPSGSIRTTRINTTNETGLHTLQTMGSNGCVNQDVFDVVGDYAIPDLQVNVPDSLFCGLSGTQLRATSSAPGTSFRWTGPMSFATNAPDPFVFTEGQYFVRVNAPNGCFDRDTVDVFASEEIFDFSFNIDSLTCNKDTATIEVVSNNQNLIYNWLSQPNLPSGQNFSVVNAIGQYEVIILDTLTGCNQLATANVDIDDTRSAWSWVRDTISCTNPTAEITFDLNNNQRIENITWTLPDGTQSNDSILIISEPGVLGLLIEYDNGCARSSSYTVVSTVTEPIIFLEAPDLGCHDSIQIEMTQFDTVENYSWMGPNNFTSFDENPFVQDTGLYIVTVFDAEGCTNETSIFISADTNVVPFTVNTELLNCIDPTSELAIVPQDTLLGYEWTDGLSTIGTDSILDVATAGTYIAFVTGINECVSSDTIMVLPEVFPEINLSADTITCSNQTVLISASTDITNPQFEWVDALGLLISDVNNVSVEESGPFSLRIVGDNGCLSDTSFTVVVDTVSPIAIVEQLNELLCQERDIMLSAEQSTGTGTLGFQWSSVNGMILNGAQSSVVLVQDSGEYQLVVEDLNNGCTDTMLLEVLESENSILAAFFDVVQPACIGDQNASITLDSITGGSGELTLIFGDEIFADSTIQMIGAGEYQIIVSDEVGCMFETIIDVPPTAEVEVDLGEDREIFIGDTVHLDANTDIDSADIVSVTLMWNDTVLVNNVCPACTLNIVMPLQTTTYSVMVENALGCILTDQVTIFVKNRGNIFVPNVFTPNGDNVNDVSEMFAGPGIFRVERFEIYNRYGNQVYGKYDFDPYTDPPIWDGRLNEVLLNPGVFAWHISYSLINEDGTGQAGRKINESGNITLLR